MCKTEQAISQANIQKTVNGKDVEINWINLRKNVIKNKQIFLNHMQRNLKVWIDYYNEWNLNKKVYGKKIKSWDPLEEK